MNIHINRSEKTKIKAEREREKGRSLLDIAVSSRVVHKLCLAYVATVFAFMAYDWAFNYGN